MNFKQLLNLDKVYVINLKKDEEKRELMKKKLKKYNIEAEFIKAIDGNSEVIYEKYLKKKKNYITIPFISKTGYLYRSPGAYGCLLSHIKVIEDAIKKKYNKICIFEDDIIFHKNFLKNLKNSYEKLKIPDYDILYLGTSEKYKFSFYDYYYSNFLTCGFFAVVLKSNIFIDLLNLMKREIYPDDMCLIKLNCKKVVIYPNLIIANLTETKTFINDRNFNEIKEKYFLANWHLNNYDINYTKNKNILIKIKNEKKKYIEDLFYFLNLFIIKILIKFNLYEKLIILKYYVLYLINGL